MWKESEECIQAMVDSEIDYTLLDEVSANKLKETIYSRFTKDTSYQYPLWEQLAAFRSVIFDFAWEWYSELLRNTKVIVFFEEANDKSAFVLNDGGVIPEIMYECPAMTFYVTNESADFLYAFHSDHSILRVSGNAQGKLERYIRDNNINVQVHQSKQ
jgi:hypothetical protein